MENEQPLVFQIKSLSNQIRRLLERTSIANNQAGLTGMQYGILGYIRNNSKERDIFQKDLEMEFNIRRSTVSVMICQLEKEGYLRRENVSGDARLKRIVMLPKAEELDLISRQHMAQVQRQLTKNISDEELRQFYKVLKKISENADS